MGRAVATVTQLPIETVYGGTVVRVAHEKDRAVCQLGRGAPLFISNILGRYVGSGDEMVAPLGGAEQAGTELYVRKAARSRPLRDLYQAPIGYVTQPKEDKRKELFVMAEVRGSRLGVTASKYPPAEPGALWLLAPQRGLIVAIQRAARSRG